MLIAKVESGVVVDVRDYQDMFPNTSFTESGPNDAFMQEHGCVHVFLTKPHDPATQKLTNVDWYVDNGVAFNVVVENKTQADISAELESLKTAKRNLINTWRLQANRGSFTHMGKQFACDELSRSDIDGVTSQVTLTGSLPVNWPGAWKAIDNTYLPIANVDDWKAFVGAMVQEGTANFIKSQTLKSQLEAATTKEEIESIVWQT